MLNKYLTVPAIIQWSDKQLYRLKIFSKRKGPPGHDVELPGLTGTSGKNNCQRLNEGRGKQKNARIRLRPRTGNPPVRGPDHNRSGYCCSLLYPARLRKQAWYRAGLRYCTGTRSGTWCRHHKKRPAGPSPPEGKRSVHWSGPDRDCCYSATRPALFR